MQFFFGKAKNANFSFKKTCEFFAINFSLLMTLTDIPYSNTLFF